VSSSGPVSVSSVSTSVLESALKPCLYLCPYLNQDRFYVVPVPGSVSLSLRAQRALKGPKILEKVKKLYQQVDVKHLIQSVITNAVSLSLGKLKTNLNHEQSCF
jgi:hypothetical protein